MNHEPDANEHIKLVANETLERFVSIAEAAKTGLQSGHAPSASTLATVNTLNSAPAVQSFHRIGQAKTEACRILAAEPAIARVQVRDGAGRPRTYYICRATPIGGIDNLASYRSPVGRLASLPVGSEFSLPNGEVVAVLERAQLRPLSLADGWDSRDTVIEAEDFGPITIGSLRALLREVAGDTAAADLIERVLAEEAERANIFEGRRRSVIVKMTLRDQPVLDQYQDEIFRLPLDTRLLLLGPPGTGKTTTLIRRVGQKLNTDFLEDSERELLEDTASAQGMSHADSWMMFTPTELLKQYLKEAFAREGVPASDRRIRTWNDFRRELARNIFGILRTANSRGLFVMKDTVEYLAPDALIHAPGWFSDFDAWQRADYFGDLRNSAGILAAAQVEPVAELGAQIAATLARADDKSPRSIFVALSTAVERVQALNSELKAKSDDTIRKALMIQLNQSQDFLDQLASHLDALHRTPSDESDELDESDQEQDDDEGEGEQPRSGRAAAHNAYNRALRAQARAAATKRTLSKTSRNARVVEWLGNRTLTGAALLDLGRDLLLQGRLRRFLNPVKRYLDGIPRRYRRFRREQQDSVRWYEKGGLTGTDIHPLEIDVVVLTILRAADEMLRSRDIVGVIENPYWAALKPTFDLYRSQVLADEATDFSPIQLAAMSTLANPRLRSFFACGDFNQRLTAWGTRSVDQFRWILPDLEIKEISVSYRQTKQLNEFARELIRATGGAGRPVSLPEHVDSEGVAPALLEGAAERGSADWLADRIREIERFVGQLPSTAIFVNAEEEVGPLAEALGAALAEQNIRVVPCREGQSVGQDNDVRVFDIQHIKGLEFEAVFYVSVDHLATMHPALFENYLYVGATRAATYLGVTCTGTLPAVIESLRSHFVSRWDGQ